MIELLKRLRERLWLRHVLLAAAALGAGLIALASYETGALNGIERQTVDARFSIRGSRPPGNSIVIVGLDHASLDALHERPPIPRVYYARLLDLVHRDHPRLVAIDAVFPGRTDANDDSALLAALARNGPILLGTEEDAHGTVYWPADVPNPRGARLAAAAVDTDPDNVLRRMLYAPIKLETLGVAAAEMVQGRPVSQAHFPGNHAWVNFRGPPDTFPVYSFIDVLDGRVPSRAFADKIVLVGITDPLQKDVFVTAVSSKPMSGVEFHANALKTILDGFPLQGLSGTIQIALLFAFAGLPALLSLRFTTSQVFGGRSVLGSASLLVLAAAIVTLLVFLIVAQLGFDSGTIVSIPDPVLALALGTVGSFAAESFVQRRQLQNLQEFFGRLPSPVSDFFISYRRHGSESVANTLRSWLVRRFSEQSVFMDTEAIEPGQPFPRRIEEAIEACNAMLVLIGPNWAEARAADGSGRLADPGDWVRREIEAGLRNEDVLVVPVLHDGAHVPDRATLPDSIKPLADGNAVYFTGADAERWIDELAQRIDRGRLRDSQRAEPAPQQPSAPVP